MYTYSRGALLAAAVAAAALVTACGSAESSQPATAPSPSASQPATPAAPGSAATTPAPAASAPASQAPVSPSAAAPSPSTGSSGGTALAMCRTSNLRISVDDSAANGAAGSAYYPLNFINTSATACEMYGYPGVSFAAAASSAGKQIGLAAERTAAFPKIAVRLGPGGTAHAWVKVSFAGNYPASQCHPVTANWLRVYPPGETVAGYVGHAFSACSSTSVTQLTVLPVREGLGLAGVTP